jgi:hypothetical protein
MAHHTAQPGDIRLALSKSWTERERPDIDLHAYLSAGGDRDCEAKRQGRQSYEDQRE